MSTNYSGKNVAAKTAKSNRLFMVRFICISFFVVFAATILHAQNIGIGTTTPSASAVLEVRSSNKGILFPRMTTAQRDAIVNPANTLHIFNMDDGCLNYYDSMAAVWNCYCDECRTNVVSITSNRCRTDFFSAYATGKRGNRFVVNIAQGVTLSGCNPGDHAISFENMPVGTIITINNRGSILGAGGNGGAASRTRDGQCNSVIFTTLIGDDGGDAIRTKAGVQVIVNNYGLIAAGGGGGGAGGSLNNTSYGGGGGGGAGSIAGNGGAPGGHFSGLFCEATAVAQAGFTGFAVFGGSGGNGTSGTTNRGGGGGGRGGMGQTGAGGGGAGGAPGKAIQGGSGNVVNSFLNSNLIGIVD